MNSYTRIDNTGETEHQSIGVSFVSWGFSLIFPLIADGPITILPVVTKDLPISPRFTPYEFLLQCKFSNLTTHQPMVEFYLLTFPRFSLRKKEHTFGSEKNRTHDFRTSRCAGYLLDHSGDEEPLIYRWIGPPYFRVVYKLPGGPGSPNL